MSRIWQHQDHDGDRIKLERLDGIHQGCAARLLYGGGTGIVHLTREALADLVRAAAPLAGLKVIPQEYEYTELKPAEPAPEVDGEPGLDPEDRAAAVAAVWGGRRQGEDDG